MKITGKLDKIQDKEFTNKEGETIAYLEIQVTETESQYPNSLVANVFGDKVANFKKFNNVGDYGTLQFNSRVKESTRGAFNSIAVYRFDKETQVQETQTADEGKELPF